MSSARRESRRARPGPRRARQAVPRRASTHGAVGEVVLEDRDDFCGRVPRLRERLDLRPSSLTATHAHGATRREHADRVRTVRRPVAARSGACFRAETRVPRTGARIFGTRSARRVRKPDAGGAPS